MKKQLLLGSALLLALGVSAQSNSVIKKAQPVGIVNMAERLSAKFATADNYEKTAQNNANRTSTAENQAEATSFQSEAQASSAPIISNTFNRFSGSVNIYGYLVSSSKPLQYNRILKMFSFVQRKSNTYVVNPSSAGNSGSIVVYLGRNDGANWDSTLIWADATNLARYPQGGIYNPPGNQVDTNAYVVGSGPITGGSGWLGSWYASKRITTQGTNSTGTDTQFMSNTAPFGSATSPAMTKHDFPRYSFSSTDDGVIRAMGTIYNDVNGTTTLAQDIRGGFMAKGSFNAGAFVWTPDSMVPATIMRSEGTKQLWGQPYMAWNDAGTHGYVMFIGARQGATLNNKGWQPIVYKTTDSGNNWALTNGIDFNGSATTFSTLLNSMAATVSNSTITAPFFNVGEGIDVVVDNNNDLHIFSTAVGTYGQADDSLGYTFQFQKSNHPSERYGWFYEPGAWPYLCDFYGDGNNWNYHIIDSLGTEGPTSDQNSTTGGFANNPWGSPDPAQAVSSDSRLQISRSYDGQFMVYSWAESDTTLTSNGFKWNEFPNIKQRALRMCDGAISIDEPVITSGTGTVNAKVKDKAYFHYMSSTCKAGSSTNTSATFTVAYTVSNNTDTDPITQPVDNYFASAVVTHSFASSACGSTITTGVANYKNEAANSFVYPNPANNNFNAVVNLTNANPINVTVYNAIGQAVTSVNADGLIGKNVLNVNTSELTAGIYFVKIKVANTESTKKLIIE
ncbi:MAG: T9SS type A sorting domain-containing protein [Bacteroidia bacterium]